MWPVLSHRALHSEGPHIRFNTQQPPYLKFLMILSLNLWSTSEDRWDSESHMWAEEITYNLHIHDSFSACHIHSSQCPKSTEFQRNQDGQKFCETQNKSRSLRLIYNQGSRSNDSLESHTFLLDQNLLWRLREGHGVLRNINHQRVLLCSFLLALLFCVGPPIMLKMMTEKKKGKTGQSRDAFSFNPSLSISETEVEKSNKSSWVRFLQCFPCSYKMHMHMWAIKYKLSNFRDLKTAVHNKGDGKTQANDLTFIYVLPKKALYSK